MVSVVLPTYNRMATLARAIESVLRQGDIELELVVIDDGSTDGSSKVIKGFRDSRIIPVRLEANKGQATARNVGARMARGTLLAFQDSDDEWLPGKLARQMSILSEAGPDVGLVYGPYWKNDGVTERKVPEVAPAHVTTGRAFPELLMRNTLGTPTVLVRREVFERVGGFDERLKALEDWEFAIRVAKEFRLQYVEDPLVIAHATVGSVSTRSREHCRARRYILEKHRALYNRYPRACAAMEYSIGVSAAASGDFSSARRYLLKSVCDYPWNARYAGAAVAAVFGRRSYSMARALGRRLLG